MRKRHRKKKHLGEFKEYAVYVAIRFDKARRNFDDFLDAFLVEAVEGNRCYAGVGGHIEGDMLGGIIELGMARDKPMARVEAIRSWILAQPDVLAHRFSPLTDIWYGPFYEFDADLNPVVEGAAGRES